MYIYETHNPLGEENSCTIELIIANGCVYIRNSLYFLVCCLGDISRKWGYLYMYIFIRELY